MEKKLEEIDAATGSLKDFISQFGKDDVYNRIIVEELLKYLMEQKKDQHGAKTT